MDKSPNRLTLADALSEGRLGAFIDQEETRGVGPIDRNAFATLAATLIKVPQSEDQTSHSAPGDSLTGKRTHQGSGRHTSH